MAQDQQHHELLRNFYDALNRDDLDAALRLCGEDVEVYQAPDVVASMPAKGHKDVATYLHGWFDSPYVRRRVAAAARLAQHHAQPDSWAEQRQRTYAEMAQHLAQHVDLDPLRRYLCL